MTPQEKFEEALRKAREMIYAADEPASFDDRESTIEFLRSVHAACIEEARFAQIIRIEDIHPEIIQRMLAEARREGAEREREECIKLLLYCGFEGSAAAIRGRSGK